MEVVGSLEDGGAEEESFTHNHRYEPTKMQSTPKGQDDLDFRFFMVASSLYSTVQMKPDEDFASYLLCRDGCLSTSDIPNISDYIDQYGR